MTAEISEAARRDMIARREEHKALFESKIDEAKAEHTAEFERHMNRLRGHSKEKGGTPEDDQGEGQDFVLIEEIFPKMGRNTSVYLNDGRGCEQCNFTGNMGGWIAGRWHHYPQFQCDHCGPSLPSSLPEREQA